MSGAHAGDDRAVLLLGCGFTGQVVAQRLAFAGRPVVGTSRTAVGASVIRTRGARGLVWDGQDMAPLQALRGRLGAVVSFVPPTLPPPRSPAARTGAFEDVHERVLEFLANEPVDRFVYVSSTSVYGDRAGGVVDEASELSPDSPSGHARVAIEQMILASGLPTVVVRPAGIYGPGRSLLHRLAAGRLRLIGQGEAVGNRVHVHDLATTILRAVDRGESGRVYLASDEQPAPRAEVAAFAVERFGLPAPRYVSDAEARVRLSPDSYKRLAASRRVDASATRDALGVRLRYPSYREGLEAIWRQEGASILDGAGE